MGGGSLLRNGSNDTFLDGLTGQYTVCSNKCILRSFKFLASNFDIHLIWTHCISINIFNVHMKMNYNAKHTSCKLTCTLLLVTVNEFACVTYQVSLLDFIEILKIDINFMTKELVLALADQVLL